MPSRRLTTWLFVGCFLMLCLAAAASAGLGAGLWLSRQLAAPSPPATVAAAATVPLAHATPDSATEARPSATSIRPAEAATAVPAATPLLGLQLPKAISRDEAPPEAFALLDSLKVADFPAQDYYESARRLGGQPLGPRTVAAPSYQVGDRRAFFTDSGVTRAELVLATEHGAYWWDEARPLRRPEALRDAIRQFEVDYLPPLVAMFGEPWQPGMDGDSRFHVVHLASFDEGSDIGYFDGGDEYPLSVVDYSNQGEIVYLNMAQLDPGEELYFGTLVHEMLHMVQWSRDGNESRWLDEGLAQVGETIVGLETVDTFFDWLAMPDVQLNSWSDDADVVYANYGAAYLFGLYFWEQQGDAATAALFDHPANGLASVEAVLAEVGAGRSLAEFLDAWAVANLLDGKGGEGERGYRHVDLGEPLRNRVIRWLPADHAADIPQFGVHYVDLLTSGPVTITFAGDTIVPLFDGPPPSGGHAWLAPPLDNLAATLTRSVDLSGLDRATLTFSAWYDLERDWDYAYVTASTDGGATWTVLEPRYAEEGPFGPAFNGRSAAQVGAKLGWVTESINLDEVTGGPALLRIEVLTDASGREGGIAVDWPRIPELDAPGDVAHERALDELWHAAGFVPASGQLPQLWSVQLVSNDAPDDVQRLPLNGFNEGRWRVNVGRKGATLIIMPQTLFTTLRADYWLSVEP